jgi:hypothetical protein
VAKDIEAARRLYARVVEMTLTTARNFLNAAQELTGFESLWNETADVKDNSVHNFRGVGQMGSFHLSESPGKC